MDRVDTNKEEPAVNEHNEYATGDSTSLNLQQIIAYDAGGPMGIVRSPYVFGAALLASFGGFPFGYDQGVISLIFVMPELHNHFPETAPGHARYGFNVGFMTGMLELGAFIGCLFFPYLADRISRKWGLTVATVFFCVGAIFQTAAWNYDSLVTGRFIGGIGVDVYVLCYAASYGPLAWTLPAEIFPNSKRAKGVGLATATIWLANFIIGVVVPEMVIKLGWGTYLFFGCFCFAAAVFSFFLVPETSKKSLEQICTRKVRWRGRLLKAC
ncbi:hypothetical protein EKO04_007741 [Ascochyta lentis]|uniref:Major facilitator superfamily (MFS) profile domain-containing protein n=1 Tax=Ascochyta lentis TaxID=205686 RepID=A0A8H7IYL6_9PLEO|nr:hypothetical protein EKO04_007741 [Ascochyta lentis]